MSEPDDPYVTPEKQGDPDLAHADSCLRNLLIWASPTIAVPFLVVICGAAWPLGAIWSVGLLVWMGGISARYGTKPHTGRVVLYVVIQLIWIPLFWAAIVWGFCATSGVGTFK